MENGFLKRVLEKNSYLKMFVESYWFLENSSNKKLEAKLFPMITTHILINLKGEYQISNIIKNEKNIMFFYPQKEIVKIIYGKNSKIMGIELTAFANYFIEKIGLENLLNVLKNSNLDLKIVQKMLDDYFNDFYHDEEVITMYKIVRDVKNSYKTYDLEKKYGFHKRTIERKFKKMTGFTIKKFSKIYKLNQILDNIYRKEKIFWADLSVKYSYYDQSHMINSLKKYMKKSPTKYLENRDFAGELFKLKQVE